MNIFTKAKDWLQETETYDWLLARLPERTSHDGILLIVVCGSFVLFGGVVKLLAWVGLGWGIYTLVRKEKY